MGNRKRGVCVDEGLDGTIPLSWLAHGLQRFLSAHRGAECPWLFAGGLAEEVDDKVLHAAFIPFGDITDIQIPLDYETGGSFGCL